MAFDGGFRGYDLNITTSKASEVSAERARAVKQHNLMVEQAHLRERERAQKDAQRTVKTARVEDNKIRSDDQSPSAGSYASPGQGRRRDDEDPEAMPSWCELLDLPIERGEKTRKKSYTFDATI